MSKLVKRFWILGLVLLLAAVLTAPVLAAGEDAGESASQEEVQEESGGKTIASALAIGLAALWLLLKKNWSVPKVIAASAALGLLFGGL